MERAAFIVEPGVEGLPGIRRISFEDLVLVTATGAETLTRYG